MPRDQDDRYDDDDFEPRSKRSKTSSATKSRGKKRKGPPILLFVGLGVGFFVLLLVVGTVAAVLLLRKPAEPVIAAAPKGIAPGMVAVGNPAPANSAPPMNALPAVPNIPNVPALPLTHHAQVISALNDTAAVLETIKSKDDFEAAKPQLQAGGARIQQNMALMSTGIFLGKLVYGESRQMKEALAADVRTNPKFDPYRAEGEVLAADPAFARAYARYNRALAAASRNGVGLPRVIDALGIKVGR